MKARVFITLKNGVLDPQGKAIGHALNGLGFSSVGEVRQGKVIDLELSETDAAKAKGKKAVKCDACVSVPTGPACVKACPTGAAMRIGPSQFVDLVEERRR